MLKLHCESAEDTEALGERIGLAAVPGAVVACYGPLGAGKTTLVRGLTRGAGSRDPVTSPTFVLLHIYEGGRLPVYHFDAYRLEGPQQLVEIGADEYLWGDGLTVVEWAERAHGILPPDRLDVRIEPGPADGRDLRISAEGPRGQRLLEALR